MKVCVIASGSSGNCTFIEIGGMKLLVDAGISARRIVNGLREIEENIDDIEGVFVTHEHRDHVQGIPTLIEKYGLRLFSNRETVKHLPFEISYKQWYELTREPFVMGDVKVQPFSVNHDAADPVAYTFQNHKNSVAVVTDVGSVTSLVREQLAKIEVIVVEANYDYQMLLNGPYPWDLKQRILSRLGHLSNIETGELISEIVHENLKQIFLAHRSENNNDEILCRDTVHTVLDEKGVNIPSIIMTHQRKRSNVYTA